MPSGHEAKGVPAVEDNKNHTRHQAHLKLGARYSYDAFCGPFATHSGQSPLLSGNSFVL